MQVTITSTSQPPLQRTLGVDDGKIVESLIAGHAPTTVKAIMAVQRLREAILAHLLQTLTDECSNLCQTSGPSFFRNISVSNLATISWDMFIHDFQSRAPTLFNIMLNLVSFHDRRNIAKVDVSHYPGLCAAVAILLKERSKNMCGLQSLVSILLYACHSEKMVSIWQKSKHQHQYGTILTLYPSRRGEY